MPKFHVYHHPVLEFRYPPFGFSAVKEGFSWPAFGFSWIWAFVKKVWAPGVLFLSLQLGSVLALEILPAGTGPRLIGWLAGWPFSSAWPPFSLFSLLGLGIGIFAGLKGNAWLEEHLGRSGYRYMGFAHAANAEAAVALAEAGKLHQEEEPDEQEDLEAFLPDYARRPRRRRRPDPSDLPPST